MSALRQRCADFLSLEVLDEQGQILAMLGDVPLSEAGRRGTLEDVTDLKSSGSVLGEWFSDDPAGACFYVTTKQTTPAGALWFSRARFSRKQLDLTLASANELGTAHLRRMSTKGSTASADSASANQGSLNPGETSTAPAGNQSGIVEARLTYPGWAVIVEQSSLSVVGWAKWVMAVGAAVLMAVVALLAGPMLRLIRDARSTGRLAQGVSQVGALAKGDGTTSERSSAYAEGSSLRSGEYDSQSCPQSCHSETKPFHVGGAAAPAGSNNCATAAQFEDRPDHRRPEHGATSAHLGKVLAHEKAAMAQVPEALEVSWLEPVGDARFPMNLATNPQDDPQSQAARTRWGMIAEDECAVAWVEPGEDRADQPGQKENAPGRSAPTAP
jgi:hypothetical protein